MKAAKNDTGFRQIQILALSFSIYKTGRISSHHLGLFYGKMKMCVKKVLPQCLAQNRYSRNIEFTTPFSHISNQRNWSYKGVA